MRVAPSKKDRLKQRHEFYPRPSELNGCCGGGILVNRGVAETQRMRDGKNPLGTAVRSHTAGYLSCVTRRILRARLRVNPALEPIC